MKFSHFWWLTNKKLTVVANSQVLVTTGTSYVFTYIVNFELVANLATTWKLLVNNRTILVTLLIVSVTISSPYPNKSEGQATTRRVHEEQTLACHSTTISFFYLSGFNSRVWRCTSLSVRIELCSKDPLFGCKVPGKMMNIILFQTNSMLG